ncbi:MAG: alpha/beta hydrolase [Gammaproteobacteria bacterium]|nr:MAG: alpha/beta hydrolase [Gammaproteobacteria bacterium]
MTSTPPHGAVQAKLDCVILLHGLARTRRSMNKISEALEKEGYRVINQGYDSRHHAVQELAEAAISDAIGQCKSGSHSEGKIHFITHSLGGILLRQYLQRHRLEKLGRAVMLAPPNEGSEVVDRLKDVPGFDVLNGPAGRQLGTGADDLPAQLGPFPGEVGVIAGDFSFNPILSRLIPGPDDGKVAVGRTAVAGQDDFIVLPVSHSFIMRNRTVIEQALHFLQHGRFDHSIKD